MYPSHILLELNCQHESIFFTGTHFICTAVIILSVGHELQDLLWIRKLANTQVSYINETIYAYNLHLLYALIIPGLLTLYNVHAMEITVVLCNVETVRV